MIKVSRKVHAVLLLQAALAPLWGYAQALNPFALQYSVPVRNAKLDAVETAIGTLPIIELRTGSPPADCATAATGTLLAQAALPSDWLAAAATGSKAKLGTWQFNILAGISSLTIGYFRIYDSQSPSTCHIQGTVGVGSGDMQVDNSNVSAGQQVTVNTFTLTAGNA